MNNLYTTSMRNTHRGISKLPENIFNQMVLHNNSIFKLLTFDNVKIIDHDNDDEYYDNHTEMDIVGKDLTRQQKTALLFKDGDDANDYRIQFQPMTDDALQDRQCRLNIYIDKIIPVDLYKSLVVINLNITCHNKWNMINDGHRDRITCIIEELLNFFNGMYLDNCVGEFFFSYPDSRNNDLMRQNLSNAKNCFGNTLTLSVYYGINDDNTSR